MQINENTNPEINTISAEEYNNETRRKIRNQIMWQIDEVLNKKNYLLSTWGRGDPCVSPEQQVDPMRCSVTVSLNEIKDYIGHMQKGFWWHPDLDPNSGVDSDDIPDDEKKWGLYDKMTIKPLSKVQNSRKVPSQTQRRMERKTG
jgi:hypothetical protein